MSKAYTSSSLDDTPLNICCNEDQGLAPLVLFLLPIEASQALTIEEMIALFNRLEGSMGRQIQTQFCHHPYTLHNVLQQLQGGGFVASRCRGNNISSEPRFWRISSLEKKSAMYHQKVLRRGK